MHVDMRKMHLTRVDWPPPHTPAVKVCYFPALLYWPQYWCLCTIGSRLGGGLGATQIMLGN